MIRQKLQAYRITIWSAFLRMLAGADILSFESTSGKIHNSSLLHGNLKRTFRIYIPPGIGHSGSPPLVILLHGRGGNAESMIILTRRGVNSLADKHQFIVVYPDGVELNWNDGRTAEESPDRAHIENIDDVGFISALADLMVKDYSVDPQRIYVGGISNGAIMSYRIGCELAHKVAAIAAVDGNMPGILSRGCLPALPVPVLAINNTDDPLVPYHGGIIHAGIPRTKLGRVLSVDESIAFWVNRNGCLKNPVTREIDAFPDDGIRVTIHHYEASENDAEVILYTIHGGGHTWPGGLQYLPEKIVGRTCRDFDANVVIWEFFKQHSLNLEKVTNEQL